MKDLDMSWEAENEKTIARMQAQLEAGEYEAVMAKHAKAMARIEVIWKAAERALGDRPEAGEAGEIFFNFKALHRKADTFATRVAGAPMPRDGSR